MSTIAEVVGQHIIEGEGVNEGALVAALIERENQGLDHIRLAAINFGLYPQIVAEVLAEASLGTPMSAEERAMIHAQYIALIQHLQGGGG